MSHCEVGLNTYDCESPSTSAEAGDKGPLRTHCRACGQPACKTCTKVQTWAGMRRARVCNDCVGDYQGGDRGERH